MIAPSVAKPCVRLTFDLEAWLAQCVKTFSTEKRANLLSRVEAKRGMMRCVKRYWEIIAENLSNAGWTLGWVSAVDFHGRTMWIADAHRADGKRFVVRADEKLTAFLELERVTHEYRMEQEIDCKMPSKYS